MILFVKYDFQDIIQIDNTKELQSKSANNFVKQRVQKFCVKHNYVVLSVKLKASTKQKNINFYLLSDLLNGLLYGKFLTSETNPVLIVQKYRLQLP